VRVAYAYAQAHREEVSHLVVVDAPLPGTAVFDRLRNDPRVWHFAFHGARDVAEMLVAGRERQYLQAFFNARCFDPSAISEADLELYSSAYAAAGAMRAGFELYRAFDRDAEDNRAALERHGKLTVPVLAVAGASSTSGPLVEEMMGEVTDNVVGLRVPGTATGSPRRTRRRLPALARPSPSTSKGWTCATTAPRSAARATPSTSSCWPATPASPRKRWPAGRLDAIPPPGGADPRPARCGSGQVGESGTYSTSLAPCCSNSCRMRPGPRSSLACRAWIRA
jgi:hypothetical protein